MNDTPLSSRARPAASAPRDGHVAEPNRLLRCLPPDEYERLVSEFEPMRLRVGHTLVEPGRSIEQVYFVREGVCSMIATE